MLAAESSLKAKGDEMKLLIELHVKELCEGSSSPEERPAESDEKQREDEVGRQLLTTGVLSGSSPRNPNRLKQR